MSDVICDGKCFARGNCHCHRQGMTSPTYTHLWRDPKTGDVWTVLEGSAEGLDEYIRAYLADPADGYGHHDKLAVALIDQDRMDSSMVIARAALDAMLKAERDKALDEAAGRIAELLTLGLSEADRNYNTGVGVAHDAILALKGASHG